MRRAEYDELKRRLGRLEEAEKETFKAIRELRTVFAKEIREHKADQIVKAAEAELKRAEVVREGKLAGALGLGISSLQQQQARNYEALRRSDRPDGQP